MTNTDNPIAGHIATIALSQSSHRRVRIEMMKDDLESARIALEVRILSILEMVAEGDPFETEGLHPIIIASAEVLNQMPGPRIVEEVRKVIRALI